MSLPVPLIFFSNFWINVSLRHSTSESLHNSCTFSCPFIYRSVLLLFSFQYQALCSAVGWTEGITEENRPYIILDLEMTLNFSTDLYELSENNWNSRLGAQKIRLRASKKKFMEAGRQEEEIKIELCVVVVLCRVRTDSEDGIVEAAW